MKCSKRDVVRIIDEQMTRLGFVKCSSFFYTKSDQRGFRKAVHFSVGTKYSISISPYVSIIHDAVEKELSRLLGEPMPESFTMRTNIGYLMPNRRFVSWQFDGDRSPKTTARRLIRAINKYSPAFFDKAASLEWVCDRYLKEMKRKNNPAKQSAIMRYLRRRLRLGGWFFLIIRDDDLCMRLPIILNILGRRDDADSIVSESLERFRLINQSSPSNHARETMDKYLKFSNGWFGETSAG